MESEDISQLPAGLQRDFFELIEPALKTKPLSGGDLFDTHALKGKLKGYRALEIEYDNVAYRLIYRVYDKPAPKRVQIISIGEHDSAYDNAAERLGK